MPKAADIEDPRVILVSWRSPSADDDAEYSRVPRWLKRFKERMDLHCGKEIKLIDIKQPADNLADQRPDTWTDFVAVWTVNYARTCRDEVQKFGSTEVVWFHQHMKEGNKRGWIAKLEIDFERRFEIAGDHLWADASRWHALPEEDPKVIFPTFPGKEVELDNLISESIKRIRNHPKLSAGPVPMPSTTAREEPPHDVPADMASRGFSYLLRIFSRAR